MEWDVDCTCPVCGEDRDSNVSVSMDGKAKCKTCGKIYKVKRTEKPRSIDTEVFKSEKAQEKKAAVISGKLPKEVKVEGNDLKKAGTSIGPRKAQEIINWSS
jgi:rubredoxin